MDLSPPTARIFRPDGSTETLGVELGDLPVDEELGLAQKMRWVETRMQLTLSPQGAVEGVSGVLTDVTERRRSEDAQRFLARASALLDRCPSQWPAGTRRASSAAPAISPDA